MGDDKVNESIMLSPSDGVEKMLFVKSNNFYQGARVTQVTRYDSLYKVKVVAHLNGHKIIDTGELDKDDEVDIILQELNE